MGASGKNTATYTVIRCQSGGCRTDANELIGEEPLLIRVEGKPYSVVMRTRGMSFFTRPGSVWARASPTLPMIS